MLVGKNGTLEPVSLEQVVIGRKQFSNNEVSVRELAERWARSHEWVRLAIRGKIFPNSEGIVPSFLTKFRRNLTDEQVLEARRAYSSGEMKQEDIAVKYGLAQTNCSRMLFGQTYKDVGEVVRTRVTYRSLSDDEVIEIRRAYSAGECTQYQISDKYDLHQKTVSHLLRGRTYKNLPGAVDDGSGSFKGKLTDQQVYESRLVFRTGQLTVKALADYYGIDRGPMQNILMGKSYRNVSLAVRRISDFAPKRAGRMIRLRYTEAMTEEERSLAKKSLLQLVSRYGDKRGLARAVGVKTEAVRNWLKQGCAPRNTHERISAITGTPKEHLRPDMHRPTGKPHYGLPSMSRHEVEMIIKLTCAAGGTKFQYHNGDREEAA